MTRKVFLIVLAVVLALSVGLVACGGTGEQQEEEEEKETYELTITSMGGGLVTAPGEGTAAYDEGTVVNLEATPDAHYRFANWTGDVATVADISAASTTIIVDGDYSIMANFEVTPMVDAGWAHTVGLRADGTVVAVGANDDGQRVVGGWTDIVQIAAGGGHTVGLKSDGTVVAVGNPADGRCDVAGWTDIVQIAAGVGHTIGLRSDGTVVAVGWNSFGQCDVGDWTHIIQVDGGYGHTIGLKADGTVVAAGWEIHGECNVGTWTGINSITAGGAHTAGCKADGTVVATGNDVDHQCDVGDWTNIVQISGGWDHTVGLKADGSVIAAGLDVNHQCDVDGWTGIVQVAAGGRHTIGLKSDGTVVAAGWNDEYHQCDVGDWDLDVGGWVLPLMYLNPRRYQAEYIFTVHNQGFNIHELRVYAPRPVGWDAQENVQMEQVSPPPSDEGVDPTHGNRMYHWQMWGQPLSGQTISFNVRFHFTAYEIRTNIDPDDVQPYDENEPLYVLYTQAEPFVEATDPQITELANQVAEGETNPYLLARRFYDYIAVTDTLEYNLLRTDGWGAKALLTTGEGECGDFAALFCALCRAVGVPARPVAGHWAVSGEQAHIWAEFYVEPFGWIPTDPTIGHVDSGWRRDYYFGAMDNQRVIFNKGFSIYLDPPTPGNDMVAHLQGPYWFFWGSGDAEDMQLEWISWMVEEIP